MIKHDFRTTGSAPVPYTQTLKLKQWLQGYSCAMIWQLLYSRVILDVLFAAIVTTQSVAQITSFANQQKLRVGSRLHSDKKSD